MAKVIKTASVLAFERKLANSDAVMTAGNWDDRGKAEGWRTIQLNEKAVRGTISNRLKAAVASDPTKLDAEIQKPNLQTVDVAALPFDTDTLSVCFTLRVLGDLATPSACNDPDYQVALAEKISGYITQYSFAELANRYAENIANGRFLWRNRVGAEEIEVRVTHEQETWVFDSHQFNLREFTAPSGDLIKLAEVIRQGLTGEKIAFIAVTAFVRLGAGQEIFPSQEMVMGGGKGDKSKFLYHLNGVAAMHSQKIGNALRTIDTWYPNAAELGPIAVEPYGSVTNRGTAYRQPKDKMDFYNLLDAWTEKDKAPAEYQQHYVMATLIRGGVFGKTDKKEKE
jgi:CRISPR-associated protein Csy3